MKITAAEKKLLPFLSKLRFLFFPLTLCAFETSMHLYAYHTFSPNFIWTLIFAAGIGFGASFLSCVFPAKANRVIAIVLTVLFTLVFEVQLVYYQIFKGFAPLSAVGLGAQAVTNFTGNMVNGIREAVLMVVAFLIPLAVLIFTMIRYRPVFSRPRKIIKMITPLVLSVAIISGAVGTMAVFFNGNPSLYSMFTSSDTSTDTSVNCFGLMMTMGQELRCMIFPQEEEVIVEELSYVTYDPEKYNVDPAVDFKALYEKAADDEELRALTAALSNMPATQKHQYTGICEGYNIVALCAEAFSPECISPEYTPTLYKLITGGFVFENFYSTFPNTTTNGEYTFCMGLFPDLTRTKTDSSFSISASNYLPYCYGNVFRDMGGIAKAYHNYVAEFYYRNYTHPNMGYDFTAANSGLNIDITWPSSDYDMMVQSVKDYAYSGKQFAAYYMTFSGHYAYNNENAMVVKNWDLVQDIEKSDLVKGYIACHLELERALTYLMETLEDAGVADKTMIVLTTDHFPYGLTDEEYSELAERPITNVFEKMRNGFICYVPGMEPVKVSSYCSSEDILPTVLNLLGVTYDSRLLAGEDALAPGVDHTAIIADGSFVSDGIRYNASSIKFDLEDNSTEGRIAAEKLYALVSKRFSVSVDILNNNYYTFVYDRESTSQAIDNITIQYSDVGIMKQSSVYFMLNNKYMDPVSEDKFGTKDSATVEEVLNVAYRIAGFPQMSLTIEDIPFNVSVRQYEGSAVWAYETGILDPELFGTELNSTITITQLARVLMAFAELNGYDVSVDAELLAAKMAEYPEISEKNAAASLFCEKHILLEDNGSHAIKVFEDPDYQIKRWYVAEEFYKLCTYYLFAE